MAKWNRKKYRKLCQDINSQVKSDYPDASDEHYMEMAAISLREEEGLEEFIKSELGATDSDDVQGRLTDDFAYPGNCKV